MSDASASTDDGKPTLLRFSRCHNAALKELPPMGEFTMVACSVCDQDYIDKGTWECKNAGHPVAPSQKSCNKCPASNPCKTYYPTLAKPFRGERCGLCAVPLEVLTRNREQRCVNSRDATRCGNQHECRRQVWLARKANSGNGNPAMPAFARCDVVDGKNVYAEIDRAMVIPLIAGEA